MITLGDLSDYIVPIATVGGFNSEEDAQAFIEWLKSGLDGDYVYSAPHKEGEGE